MELEILAPAGNMSSFKTAIANGANAVYLGLDKFNARAKAENFTLLNLKDCVDYAHIFNVKVYLVVNTLIKNIELKEAVELVKAAASCGIDAFIIQDVGLLTILHSTVSNTVLHCSTQMGIHNLEGAIIAEKLGASRVILSREVLLEDIRKIKSGTDLEIECFVQGALCVSFSGNCYFSSMVSGYSGNRGKCMQLCRKKYSLYENKKFVSENYWLSSKDLSLIDKIKDLVEAGVTSFKIEGRMRRPEYVGESTRIFRKVLDNKYKVDECDVDNLKIMFNRGDYTVGYLYNPTNDIVYHKLQGHMGLRVGTVKKIAENQAFLECERELKKGDGIKFLKDGFETGGALFSSESSKTTFVGNVSMGNDVHLTSSSVLNNDVLKREKKLSIDVDIVMEVGKFPIVKIKYLNDIIEFVYPKIIDMAINSPISKDEIILNFSKLKDTVFVLNKCDVNLNGNLFMPKSIMNDIRRCSIDNLKAALIEKYLLKENEKKIIKKSKGVNYNFQLNSIMRDKAIYNEYFTDKNTIIQVETSSQLSQDVIDVADIIVYSPKNYNLNDIENFVFICNKPVFVNLPNIARGEDLDVLKKIVESEKVQNFVINNLYGLQLCGDKRILFGHQMNFLNDEIDVCKIASLEASEVKNKDYLYSYGKIPLMTFSHCVSKNAELGKCSSCKNDGEYKLIDEKKCSFIVRNYKVKYCYSQLLNSIPLNLSCKIIKRKRKKIFIDLVGCGAEKCTEIIKDFFSGNDSKLHTSGHFEKNNLY